MSAWMALTKSVRRWTLYCVVIILIKWFPSMYTFIIYEQWCLLVYYILGTMALHSWLRQKVKEYAMDKLQLSSGKLQQAILTICMVPRFSMWSCMHIMCTCSTSWRRMFTIHIKCTLICSMHCFLKIFTDISRGSKGLRYNPCDKAAVIKSTGHKVK